MNTFNLSQDLMVLNDALQPSGGLAMTMATPSVRQKLFFLQWNISEMQSGKNATSHSAFPSAWFTLKQVSYLPRLKLV